MGIPSIQPESGIGIYVLARTGSLPGMRVAIGC